MDTLSELVESYTSAATCTGSGTLARIDAVCDEGENRSDFVRTAVARELKRREEGGPE
ncbi:YlcI/YnfO family protein [Sphingomonas sp.]|jgi:hypothetical protein|uniref:YlcI/YnfO family protein n=1 Tax=Sphingomonas sp. TaxID=28214 RepID=UPI002D7F2652|nr:YlcI/YnfO family protein [Sphingomonas sp.]HEU0045058.1 YlcI/YnfO family protein [Sphingomonas sp.]